LGGALVSNVEQPRVHLDRQVSTPVSPTASLQLILRQNGQVWLSVCGGTVSFGAMGLAVIVSNGFRFGFDAATVARSAPGELRFLLPHGVLEFLALTLAAAACQHLAWLLFELLALGRSTGQVKPPLTALASSVPIGVAAALVEVMSQVARLF
jgi:uncharacterized membrane protein SpoIIM required for sporulation